MLVVRRLHQLAPKRNVIPYGRENSRYRYPRELEDTPASARLRIPLSYILTHEMNENKGIRGELMLYFSPSARGLKKKKKKIFSARPSLIDSHRMAPTAYNHLFSTRFSLARPRQGTNSTGGEDSVRCPGLTSCSYFLLPTSHQRTL